MMFSLVETTTGVARYMTGGAEIKNHNDQQHHDYNMHDIDDHDGMTYSNHNQDGDDDDNHGIDGFDDIDDDADVDHDDNDDDDEGDEKASGNMRILQRGQYSSFPPTLAAR